jgi:hypothetical protein
MMEIKLEPSLSSCIETVAKKEYERVLHLLLGGKQEDTQLEDRLELLRLFLESADFSRLRSLSEEPLIEGKRVEFILKSPKSGPDYEIEMNEK